MFMSSGFSDQSSRDQACCWYRHRSPLCVCTRVCAMTKVCPFFIRYGKAFETEPTLHSGINVVVLLMAAGHEFETSIEIRKIGAWNNFIWNLKRCLIIMDIGGIQAYLSAVPKDWCNDCWSENICHAAADRKRPKMLSEHQRSFISCCFKGPTQTCKHLEISAVCHFRGDSEHFAGAEGQFGEDEGLLGCRLLPRSKHPRERTQESHWCLWKTLPAESSRMVSTEAWSDGAGQALLGSGSACRTLWVLPQSFTELVMSLF